jgi:flagellar biosynthesis protein FlhG
MGNLDVLMGISPPCTLADVLARRRTVEDALVTLPCGLRVVAGGSGVPVDDLFQGPGRLDLLEGLLRLRRKHDVVILDCGAGIGGEVIEFCGLADQVLVVTTPEPTAITDAYGMIKTLCLKGCTGRISVLVNMAADRHEAKAAYARIASVAKRFLGKMVYDAGFVPADAKVPASVKRRVPFVLGYPASPASRHLAALASKIHLPASAQHSAKKGLLKRILGR